MKQKQYDVVGLGICPCDYICILDKYPTADEKTVAQSSIKIHGGPVPNAICALSVWKHSTALVGRVGADADGDFLINEYNRCGVNTGYIVRDGSGTTPKAFIWVCPEKRTRAVVLDRSGSRDMRPRDVDVKSLPAAKVFHTDARDSEACIKAMKHYRKQGAAIVVDAGSMRSGIEEILSLSDHFVASSNFVKQYFGARIKTDKAATNLLSLGAGNVVVTLGGQGCVGAARDGRAFSMPAHTGRIKILDTTGAGDIFHAGYIHGLLSGLDIEKCARFGNAAAYLKCAHPGGGGVAPVKKISEYL